MHDSFNHKEDTLLERWSREAKKKKNYSNKIGISLGQHSKGIVVEVHRRTYHIFSLEDHSYTICSLHSNFNLQKFGQITVGDIIDFEIHQDRNGFITKIHPRKNHFYRMGPQDRKNQKLILASNLDQVIILISLQEPKLNIHVLDQYLLRLNYLNLPFIIGVNKLDIPNHDEKLSQHLSYLKTKNIDIFEFSCKTKEGLSKLTKKINTKKNVLTGPSGVGKSSFIKNLFPNKNISTQAVSDSDKKGKHTTVSSKLFFFPNQQGYIIDTPGIRQLAFWDLKLEDIPHFFWDWKDFNFQCQFRNCLHDQELGCAIKQAVEESSFSASRYQAYLKILREKKREQSITEY